MKSRRNRIIKLSKKITGCDTIVTFEPENLYYLTGFWGEAIGIIEKNGNATIVAPELEVGRAKSESINCDVVKSDRGYNALDKITKLIKEKKIEGFINCPVVKELLFKKKYQGITEFLSKRI